MNSRFFLSIIVTSFLAFFGGWLLFGIVFADYYMSQASEVSKVLMKNPPEMWAIAIGNIAWVLLITCVLQKVGSLTFTKGFLTSLWISFLVMLMFDISIYAFWNIYKIEFLFVDIIVCSAFWGIMGGIAAIILGSGKKIPYK
ncbi:MAG TPA: hypothetical protein VJI69_02530 [Bacteroidia bacterium]|nr:hypothetical protein [Bacteroidia bacterium]